MRYPTGIACTIHRLVVGIVLLLLPACLHRVQCFGSIGRQSQHSPRFQRTQRLGSASEGRFFRRQESDNNNNNNNETPKGPRTVLFRRSNGEQAADTATKPYVPSGMTRSEYASIRKQERAREQGMDYGAWGPRFRKTGRPDGDWMVMPNLWTFGQVRVADGGKETENETMDKGRRRPPIVSLAKSHASVLVLGYFLVDGLYSGFALWRFRNHGDSSVLKKAHGLVYGLLSLLWRGTPPITAAWKGVVQIQALKVLGAALQLPLWRFLAEAANRRWLWSKRRFSVTVAVAATWVLALVGGLTGI